MTHWIKTKKLFLWTLSAALFCLFLNIGISLSETRGLWNDEIFTQLQNVQNKTYVQILKGEVNEGNNSPLFYLIQKFITEVFQFRLSPDWNGQVYGYNDLGQIILRIQGIIWISLTLTAVFLFFGFYFSFFWSIYGIALFLTSEIIWTYWAEARPYGLWIFLTMLHCLILIKIYQSQSVLKRWHCIYFLIQLFLSLTAVFGIIQVVLGALVIGCTTKPLNKSFLYPLPILIGLSSYYYLKAFHFDSWFDRPAMDLFFAAVPKEIFIILLIYVVYLIVLRSGKFSLVNQFEIQNKFILFSFFILIFAFCLLILLILKDTGGPKGFQLTARYFVFLIPVVFMSFIFCADNLLKIFKTRRFIKINLYAFMIFVLIKIFLTSQFVQFNLVSMYLNN